MITLEQVRQLESRVKGAVELIDTLRGENNILKERLEKSEHRLRELETLVDGFRNDQDQIEQGIRDILDQLNALEDDIHTEQTEAVTPGPDVREEHTETVSPYNNEPPVGETQTNESGRIPPTGNDQEDVSEDERADETDEDQPEQLDIF